MSIANAIGAKTLILLKSDFANLILVQRLGPAFLSPESFT